MKYDFILFFFLKSTFIFCFQELFQTERAHVRMLKVLDHVFYQKLTKEAILPTADIKNIFTNLEEILQLHGTILHLYTTRNLLTQST